MSGKAKVLSTLGSVLIAGGAMMVAPVAKAQVAFGVQIGTPRYDAPAPVYAGRGYVGVPYNGYGDRGYWDHHRDEDWRARQWREQGTFDRHRDGFRDRHFDGRGWR